MTSLPWTPARAPDSVPHSTSYKPTPQEVCSRWSHAVQDTKTAWLPGRTAPSPMGLRSAATSVAASEPCPAPLFVSCATHCVLRHSCPALLRHPLRSQADQFPRSGLCLRQLGGTAGSSGAIQYHRALAQPGPGCRPSPRGPLRKGPGLAHPLKNRLSSLCALPSHREVGSRDINLIITGIQSHPEIPNIGVCVPSPNPQV